MPLLLSALVVVVCAVIGAMCGGSIGDFSVRWLRMQRGQGNEAYYVMGMVVMGAIAGAVMGVFASAVMTPHNATGLIKPLGISAASMLAITGVWLGALRFLAHIPPQLDGMQLTLQLELRLPPGEKARGDFVDLHAARAGLSRKIFRGNFDAAQARQEDGRWILPASMKLETALGTRWLKFQLGGHLLAQDFDFPLPKQPGKEHLQWSDWLGAAPGQEAAAASAGHSYRFRLEPIVPRNLQQEAADLKARLFAASKAELDAIAADAPLKAYLKYFRYGPPEGIPELAMARVMARPHFVAEMQAAMVSDDLTLSSEILRLVRLLPKTAPPLLREMEAAGRDIAERIRRANAMAGQDDPDFKATKDAATRFEPWLKAVGKLRAESGGDFIPELKLILEHSRQRPNDPVMRKDVRRLASLALRDWARIKPQPGDLDEQR